MSKDFNDLLNLVLIVNENRNGQHETTILNAQSARRLCKAGLLIKNPNANEYVPTGRGFAMAEALAKAMTVLRNWS